ncbi:MAG: phosphodiester glycosidase family protein, partial [Clostridia bacterium]|nr:phosphodiester glycosidase family protein [Clostridia bacterium]
MLSHTTKRILSVFLTVMMLLSVVPMQVFASDAHTHDEEAEVFAKYDAILAEIDTAVAASGAAAYMTDAQIARAALAMDANELDAFYGAVDAIKPLVRTLNADEIAWFNNKESVETFGRVYAALEQIRKPAATATSGSHTPVTGVRVDVSGATDNSLSGGTVTVTAKGSGGFLGIGASAKTTTILVDNESGAAATVSFDWTATNMNQLTIDGTVRTGSSGSFSKLLAAGETFTITIVTGKNSTTNTLKMSNFAVTAAATSSNVTFDYDSASGSVTVNGTAVADGGTVEIPLEGATVTATANTGSAFLGWTDVSGNILSTSASFTLKPAADMTVKAAFAAAGTAWFLVDNAYMVEGLAAAIAAAKSTIVILNNGTVSAGSYTIPAGITLLVPFDSANTLYTTTPKTTGTTYTAPTVYRTLTLASGAHITVNGAISLSSKVVAAAGGKNAGSPSGPVSMMKMEAGSSITVNSGASLYAWGFITGSGSILAKSGSKVYECFQFEDYRGGSQTTDMKNEVFPLSQYYVQNIEVPLTLEAGATETSFTAITVSIIGEQTPSVSFIASSGAMFNLTSGTVTKRYDGATDRLIVEVNGSLSMSPITMKVSISSIKSADYILPINSNISLTVKSGSNISITQDISMLPGSEIIVEEGAVCTIGQGVKVQLYDADQWDTYCFGAPTGTNMDVKFQAVKYAPGRTYTRTEADLVDAKVIVSGTIYATSGYLYTTAGGAAVTGTDTAVVYMKSAPATTAYQLRQAGNAALGIAAETYDAIPMTSAKLMNADGTYLETTSPDGTYTYANGAWIMTCAHQYTLTGETAPTCTETGSKTYVCVCGDIYTETIDALGHTAGANATCTEDQVCTVCGATVTPALGHTEVIDAAVAPTCTENGLTEGSHCSVCNATIVAQEVVPATGHKAGENASCTEDLVCTVCGETISSAGGHVEETVPAVAPTCTATGLTEGKRCSVCGEIIVAQEEVAALGHTEVIDAAVAPTCTETGLTEGKHCSVCGEVTVAQEKVDALGHTEEIIPGTPAGCETTGISDGIVCSVCGEVIAEQTETPATGHNIQSYPGKAPTYTDEGYHPYESCDGCEYSTFVLIPMLETPSIDTYEEFITNLGYLETLAQQYAYDNPNEDPLDLVIKYIRTGVERYNSGSWGIMAGYENAAFAKYVREAEDAINSQVTDGNYFMITGLKEINPFILPNGDYVDFSHMFGVMDMTHHNKGSINHADVGGWAGDLVDLLSTADRHFVSGSLEDMVAYIHENYVGVNLPNEAEQFGESDMFADLDAYYVMDMLYGAEEYAAGDMAAIMADYFTTELTLEDRADFFIRGRLDGAGTRAQLRDAVYAEYTGNKVIATLEGTREFNASDLTDLRRAVCYAFADYICELAGDYIEDLTNPYFTPFSNVSSTLAPGVTQEIKHATTADGKQLAYYVATGDITRDDVNIYANYNNNDPAAGWKMSRVEDQANAAQAKYGDPTSPYYIPNYTVVASTNGAGYNMTTGEPGGLLIMGGVEYHPINASGFFGILKDGTPVIGTTEEYEKIYKGRIQEGIAGFGAILVKDGEINVTAGANYAADRASRTAVGITASGKVVLVVADGRQEPVSCGCSMIELAHIMKEAGCVIAVNLDGGGSSTYVAKQEGDDELSLVNTPSDGFQRSVSASLMFVSTAPSATAFDHAKIESDYSYATVGTPVQLTPVGVSATGASAELPAGTTWAVSDAAAASVDANGVFTGYRLGPVTVYLMLDGAVIGQKTMTVANPDKIYFKKATIDAVYESAITLPVAARYENKEIAINENDVIFSFDNPAAATISGFTFVGHEASGLKVVKVSATLAAFAEATASITVNLYRQGENTFDFEKATGGDRLLAWYRTVTNSTTEDDRTYTVVDPSQVMTTDYVFAMDMSQIPIPEVLSDLIYMLPGADMADASAWTFLLQLAERVSVLTEVTPVLYFDPNFDVDYSELTIINEYFTLTGTTFDEATNSLTMKLSWIDQTQAIDPETANPLCIVNGIKLTPKADAAWNTRHALTPVHTGSISYNIFLRANALYSFALKPENQEIYGLIPFVNPNDESEKGASFGAIYKEMEDTYTLVNAVKAGWVVEDGGYAYYVAGERLTGIAMADGYYYDFGVNGVNTAQTKYTGLIIENGGTLVRYAKLGEIMLGWHQVNGDFYYFDPATSYAVTGVQTIDGYTYTFEDYVLVRGDLVEDATGKRYRWAGTWMQNTMFDLDGNTYFAQWGAYLAVGIVKLSNSGHYYFDTEGVWQKNYTGLLDLDGYTYYIRNGIAVEGLVYAEDGYYYYFPSTFKAVKDCRYWISYDNGLGFTGWHYFDELGRMILEEGEPEQPGEDTGVKNGIVRLENGNLAYYIDNVMQNNLGLFIYNGYYYYCNSSSVIVTGTYWVTTHNNLGYTGWQDFDEEGRMLINGEPLRPDGWTDHEHAFSEWAIVTEPTCTETGLRARICSCDLEETETIPATGHAYGEFVITTDPTCTETGVQTKTCANCGDTITEEVPATGHSFGAWAIKSEPTCTEVGINARLCACGAEETEEIPATGHAYGEFVVTTPATCTEDGVKTQTCANCGDTITETIDAIGHAYGEWIETPATCTAAGSKSQTCANCGDTISEEIPATGHAYGEFVVTTPATCTEAGVQTKTCANCGDTITEEIPATGHSYTAGQEIDAEHPHAVYGVCECGEKQLQAESSTVAGCPVCEPFAMSGASMTLGNELSLSFFFPKAKIPADEECYVVVTKEYADGRADVTRTFYPSEWDVLGGSLYYVSFNGIAAKEMADKM